MHKIDGTHDMFLWGSATASYQVEGGINNTDWALGAREGRLPVCGDATDHYNLFEQDFDIAKSLGHNAHRFSIEWARIEPEEGVFDDKEIEHYRTAIRALRMRGIEPMVTLWHFTLPTWFSEKGGFLHPKAKTIFTRYCSFVAEKLQSEVNMWVTINEPFIWASKGYQAGDWPPFQKNTISFLRVLRSLSEVHREVYTVLKKISPRFQIGIAKHNIYFWSDKRPWNIFAARTAAWFWNRRFLNVIKGHQDFIGLNHYFNRKFGSPETFPKTEMGWDIYPEALYKCLKELSIYKKPIYITENGIADSHDEKRAEYIREYISAMQKARREGVDVRGYFYWSLLDNYEWALGFDKRFGLVEIDYSTKKRTVRPSAYVYKEIIEESKV